MTQAVTNTVNSVSDTVSDVGKSTGLSQLAQSLNLAGSNSIAEPVGAVVAAVYAPELLAATAEGDAAAYEAAQTGVQIGGPMTQAAITSSDLAPLQLQSLSELDAQMTEAWRAKMMASTADTSLWSTAKEIGSGLSNAMTIKNAFTGKTSQIPQGQTPPGGWYAVPDYSSLGIKQNALGNAANALPKITQANDVGTDTGGGLGITTAGLAALAGLAYLTYRMGH